MNLYMVCDSNYDWCCFAFDTSRNRAKMRAAEHFFCEYTDMRCKTLRKGINVSDPKLIYDEDCEGYDIVKNCGFKYEDDSELGVVWNG